MSIERRSRLPAILHPLALVQYFVKIVNDFAINSFCKKHHLRCWQDYEQHKNNLPEIKNEPQSVN